MVNERCLEALLPSAQQQLSPRIDVFRSDISRLTCGEVSRISGDVEVQSLIDPGAVIAIHYGSRRVDSDGAFPTAGPVHLLIVQVGLDRSASGAGANSERAVTYAESSTWMKALLPGISHCYLLEDPTGAANETPQHWFFVCFIGINAIDLSAPSDFDWAHHRIRYPGLLVTRIGASGDRIEVIYRNDRFHKFYQPYMEGRGRYWDITLIRPPDHSRIRDCFEVFARTVTRRGIIAADVRPLTLIWKSGHEVELTLKNETEDRCFTLSLIAPSSDDLASREWIIEPPFGDIRPVTTNPEQYSAGEIDAIRKMHQFGIKNYAPVTECP